MKKYLVGRNIKGVCSGIKLEAENAQEALKYCILGYGETDWTPIINIAFEEQKQLDEKGVELMYMVIEL